MRAVAHAPSSADHYVTHRRPERAEDSGVEKLVAFSLGDGQSACVQHDPIGPMVRGDRPDALAERLRSAGASVAIEATSE